MTPAVARAVSAAFGFAMAAAAAIDAHGAALVVAIGAAVTVLVGLRFRVAATAAVLLAGTALTLSDAGAAAALAGLCAAGYLVLRHTTTVERPTVVAAVGFAFAGLAAAWFTPQAPWLPLLAPVAVIGVYVAAVQPFGKVR